MWPRKLIVILLLALAGVFSYSSVDRMPDNFNMMEPGGVEFIPPEKIMLSYYKAVDRGELVVFGIQLDRTMLIPVRVEYAYPVNGQIPRIKVYAELKKPIQIPEQDNNMFTGVCAIIDMFGKIVETEAHIFIK